MKKHLENLRLIMSSNKTTIFLWVFLIVILFFIIVHNKLFNTKFSFNEFTQHHMSNLYEIKNYPFIAPDKKDEFLKQKVESINKTQVKSIIYPSEKQGNIMVSYKIDNENFIFKLAPSAYSCQFLKNIKNNKNFTAELELPKHNLGNTTSCIRNIATITMTLNK